MGRLSEIEKKYNRYRDSLLDDFMDIEIHMEVANEVPYLLKKVKAYEKALEDITRQYDNVSVNRAKEIAIEALGATYK